MPLSVDDMSALEKLLDAWAPGAAFRQNRDVLAPPFPFEAGAATADNDSVSTERRKEKPRWADQRGQGGIAANAATIPR